MSWDGYTPSMRAAKFSYVAGAKAILARGGYASNTKVLGGEFDRFLANVRAEAWAEGFDAGERDVFEHERNGWDRDCIPNPYRKDNQ